MSVSGVKKWNSSISTSIQQLSKQINHYKLQSQHNIVSVPQETPPLRRHLVLGLSISLITTITPHYNPVFITSWAGEEANGDVDVDNSVVGALKSLFDPNEKTKSGKVLPKGYLKSARDVVNNLRESLKEDPKDSAKFRRTADAAKESIREYLSGWRGEKTVVREKSYVEIEKAIRSLAGFYSKAGPSAPLPEDVKSEILNDLNSAEEFL